MRTINSRRRWSLALMEGPGCALLGPSSGRRSSRVFRTAFAPQRMHAAAGNRNVGTQRRYLRVAGTAARAVAHCLAFAAKACWVHSVSFDEEAPMMAAPIEGATPPSAEA